MTGKSDAAGSAAFSIFKELEREPVILLDRDGTLLDANELAIALLDLEELGNGARLSDLVETPDDFRDYLRRCSRSTTWLPSAVLRRDAEASRLRVFGARCGSSDRIVLRVTPTRSDGGTTHYNELNRQLERAARELVRRRRVEQLLRGEREVVELVAEGAPLEDCVGELLMVIQRQTTCMAAGVFRVDDGCLRSVANVDLSEEFIHVVEGTQLGPTVGTCGASVHREAMVVSSDILTDPLWSGFGELAQAEGIRACWSVPITTGRTGVVGTIALFYGEPREPSPHEVEVVEKATRIAALAFSRDRFDAERAEFVAAVEAGHASAVAANEAKDHFIAMLGHELRNPLGAMMTAAEVLEHDGVEAAERERLLAVLKRQGRGLTRILEDLLDVARVDSGKLTLRREPIGLHESVDACIEALRPRIAQRLITLDMKTAPVYVDADPTRVDQIMRNVCDNAVKYGNEGGTLAVRLERDNGDAVFSVKDDGEGIEPEFLEDAFEPFAQSPQSLVRSDGGIGLGLPLVKRLVELHGGTIELRSPGKDKGTTVEIRLPAIAAPAAEEGADALRPDAADDAAGKRVLVVEDSDDARASLVRLLEAWGFEPIEASDGIEGLDLARTSGASVALIDVGLPGLDGYAVAREIRAMPSLDGIQLIAMTGYGQAADKHAAMSAGFDEHLVKPVDLERLRELLTTPSDT